MTTRATALILLGWSTLVPGSVWSQGGADAAYLAFLNRTCASGATPSSCLNLAEAYATGQGVKGVPKDPAKAAEFYKRWADASQAACDKGDEFTCSDLARAYEAGRGVPADAARAASLDKKALPLFQQGCDQGNEYDCAGLAAACQYGRALPKDLVRAATLYKKACAACTAPVMTAPCQKACEQAKALKAP
jgi:TPR repeat protein